MSEAEIPTTPMTGNNTTTTATPATTTAAPPPPPPPPPPQVSSPPLPRKRTADDAALRFTSNTTTTAAPPPHLRGGPAGAAVLGHPPPATAISVTTATTTTSGITIQPATVAPRTATVTTTAPTKPPPPNLENLPISGSTKKASPAASDRGYKGLRQFSMLVCKKVEEKGTTTYNEVADELVLQVMQENDKTKVFDEKNIRRRVYDALNVLMAMDIITKDKKAISWKGLPTSASQDLDMLGRERDFRLAEIAKKRQTLQEMLVQQVCYRNLVARNAAHGSDVPATQKIPLPFLVVNTHASAVIQCNMSPDLTDVTFDFSMPFEINDDNTILNRLGLHKTDWTNLREMMPEEMLQYCQRHGLLDAVLSESANVSSEAGGTVPPSTGEVRPSGTVPACVAAAAATSGTL